MKNSTGPRPPLTRIDGELALEQAPLGPLAAANGTPLYAYSGKSLDDAYRAVDGSLAFVPHLIAYAVKANSSLAILSRLGKLGAGADIVSGGELARALRAGIPAKRIVFSGVGKQDHEIEAALKAGIRSLHLESAPEADAVLAVARRLNVRAPLSIRVNPNVNPETHPYIATGLHGTKFGVEPEEALALAQRLAKDPNADFEGMACHIGSQVSAIGAMREAVERVGEIVVTLRKQGIAVRSLDAGGGWPIQYGDDDAPAPAAEELGGAIRQGLDRAGIDPKSIELVVEPGRYIAGPAGVLVTRVLFVKDQGDKRFVIVDAAMNDLIRPALYEAHHEILAVRVREGAARAVNVVGPVCETGDFFAMDRKLAPVEAGDLLVIRDAGAYGMSMASQYNSRPRAAEVIVEGAAHRVIRDRETHEDLWLREHL
jgi:diaminopimelate decarboxylase